MLGIQDHMIKRVKYTINTFNGFRFCNKNCEDEEVKFICGSDGSLYRNYCEMKKAHCGRHVYQVCGLDGDARYSKGLCHLLSCTAGSKDLKIRDASGSQRVFEGKVCHQWLECSLPFDRTL